jgi:hypothetical protein
MKTKLLSLLLVLGSVTAANAQWIQQKKEDPFDGKHLYIAVTASGSYGFGVRCEAGTDRPELILITPEKLDTAATNLLNLTSPKLVIIVDDSSPREVDATLSTGDEGQLIIASNDDPVAALAAELVSARRRVAVAVAAGGEKFHKTQFGVSGTKRAVGSVVAG